MRIVKRIALAIFCGVVAVLVSCQAVMFWAGFGDPWDRTCSG
jgi:hypothetical protein